MYFIVHAAFVRIKLMMMMMIKTNSTLYSWYAAVLVLPGDRYMELKISNAAYNADITQSQERDTRHRRMQEVNSL